MPVPITFDWSEDEAAITFVLHVRGATAKTVDIALCDVYVKVNVHPALFEADLLREVDPEHPKTRCRVGANKVTLSLRKKEPGLWGEFRAPGSREELRQRRQAALAASAEREQERLKRKEDFRQSMIKAGEHEQWRLDRENRERIEKWEQDEKAKWEAEVYASFDEDTKAAVGPAAEALPPRAADDVEELPAHGGGCQDRAGVVDAAAVGAPQAARVEERADASEAQDTDAPEVLKTDKGNSGVIWSKDDLDDTEEYVPEVRGNPGKVGVRFTERPRPGVPVRDRGGPRQPPMPRQTVKADAPPMLAGDEAEDECDPVWLKDKADSLMVLGDYRGAHNAYTEALKLALNPRAFANRAVASLYLGNLEQCVEDCGHALRLLDKRRQSQEQGGMPGAEDPEDHLVRARVEVRAGTAYLWLGALGKAEAHLASALEAEQGLDFEERQRVKADLARVQNAKAALSVKEKADTVARRAAVGATDVLETALGLYQQAAEADGESAVVHANRCFALLQAGQLEECLVAGEASLSCLRRWAAAAKPPKKPLRPSRLDPPFLDDPTFKHPDEQNQKEVDWLMKHGGGTVENLPSLPVEYEWIKDANESGDAWIAVRKKMPKATIDAIRQATVKLQDALYTRQPDVIRDHVKLAIELNRAGEGPSNKAIHQAEEYAGKLEEHEKERAAEREREENELKEELEEFDLERALAPSRAGAARSGFGPAHPVECTRRRLFAKVSLRRARALELLGSAEASETELQAVLRVEPANAEAKRLLSGLRQAPAPAAPGGEAAEGEGVEASPPTPSSPSGAPAPAAGPPGAPAADGAAGARRGGAAGEDLEDGGTGEDGVDHASTAQLLSSAAEYMRRNDYASALQIYSYVRKCNRSWESPLVELKVLSNASLCLQRLRGRLPELVAACNEVLDRIEDLREDGGGGVPEETLLQMECACLSRRGSAYSQQRKPEESARDAARVRELLARQGDAAAPPAP